MKRTLLLFATTLFSASLFAQWTEQATGFSTASRGINQIIITSTDNAWVAAYNGTTTGSANVRDFSRTTDGGATWTAGTVTAPSSSNWSCFTAVDENTAWAMFYKATTGSTGSVFKTTDGGTTWAQQGTGQIYTTAGASFPDVIYFWDANTGVAVGDPVNSEYEIYTSTDGGTTWNAVDGANIPAPTTGEFGLTRSFAARDEHFWFGTNDGRIFKSSDHGSTWEAFSTGYSGYQVISMDFATEDLGWVSLIQADVSGNITDREFVRTSDGGITWTTLGQSYPYHYGDFSYVPNTEMTLVSTGIDFTNGDLGSSYSLDGGDSWVVIDSGDQRGTVEFYNNFTGWAGGFNADATTGGIFKYDESFTPTDVQPVQNNYQFKLYPNPSNGLFYISFDAENNLPINVQITDALGRVVFQNTYKDKSQLWLRSIDLRNYSRGVYFVKVENDGNETMKKVVVE